MVISGLQKLTLLDYPTKIACTVFTENCNLRCPFCHNALLVTETNGNAHYTEEEIFEFLEKRKNVLEGVVVSGGEPLLQQDISQFLRKVKQLGYSVKLDTNGTFPQKLKQLVRENLVDYVALDVKNSKELYAKTVGTNIDVSAVEQTVEFLLQNNVDYEFRTTVVQGLHTAESIKSLAERIAGAKRYYLQMFVSSPNLIDGSCRAVSKQTMQQFLQIAQQYVPSAEIRGVE